MSDDVDNIFLAMLREIRNDIGEIKVDVVAIKQRIEHLEGQ